MREGVWGFEAVLFEETVAVRGAVAVRVSAAERVVESVAATDLEVDGVTSVEGVATDRRLRWRTA